MNKLRADELLLHYGLVESREKAKRLIMAGEVYINGEKVDKASRRYSVDSEVTVKKPEKYVSRGGYKIESAWKKFNFDVRDKVCCDIGASTGGFTDFLLQHGARKVYAIDAGRGQLHWKLRKDNRVCVMEKTNARYITIENLGEKVDFVTCDVSFISVSKIIQSIYNILKDKGEFLILIKPQFEATREKVKKGVVKNKETHKEVISKIIDALLEAEFFVKDIWYSEIKGPKGNIEYFVYGTKEKVSTDKENYFRIVSNVVEQAHRYFGGNKG
ncbi:MAG: TlyA family RNA methyltransferase [Thermotogaceae bacterium]|nr:TlyA family RNA methyltransferase [Thermotogaceae bacterium]